MNECQVRLWELRAWVSRVDMDVCLHRGGEALCINIYSSVLLPLQHGRSIRKETKDSSWWYWREKEAISSMIKPMGPPRPFCNFFSWILQTTEGCYLISLRNLSSTCYGDGAVESALKKGAQSVMHLCNDVIVIWWTIVEVWQKKCAMSFAQRFFSNAVREEISVQRYHFVLYIILQIFHHTISLWPYTSESFGFFLLLCKNTAVVFCWEMH